MSSDQPHSDAPVSHVLSADELLNGCKPVNLEDLQALVDRFVATTLETVTAADAHAVAPLDPAFRAQIERIARKLGGLDDMMARLRQGVEHGLGGKSED